MVDPILLIVLPLIGAFSLPLVGRVSHGLVKGYTAFYLFLNALISAVLLIEVNNSGKVIEEIAGFPPPIGIFLAVGVINAILAALINGLAAFNYITYGKKEKSPFLKFSILYLLCTASSTGIILTGDIFNMFVFFEITAVASYALVASSKNKNAIGSAFKYMILGSIGSSFILIGISLIYSELRTLNLYDIAYRVSSISSEIRMAAFTFLIVGIGVEAEIFPFNGWVPSVYGNSDGNVSSFLIFAPSKASIYAILRLLLTLFYFTPTREIGMFLGLLTLIVGEVAALGEKDPKRMLAFSSIGQMGLILIAISLGTLEGVVAAVFLIVSHATGKATLFLSSDSYKSGGLKNTLTGVSTTLGVLILIGMPPFAGFWGKWYLLIGSAGTDRWIVIITVIFTSIVEAYYFSRFLQKGMHMKGKPEETPSYVFNMMLMITVAFLFGIFAGFFYELIQSGVGSLLSGGV